MNLNISESQKNAVKENSILTFVKIIRKPLFRITEKGVKTDTVGERNQAQF